MCYTALLLLEVYQHVPADTGLGSLAARYLGHGQWITGFSMMFLMYALTAAYISGAGELIASSVNDWFGMLTFPPATGVIFFTVIGGGVVCVGTSLVDLFNRFLFSAKIIFLGGDARSACPRTCTKSIY